MSAFQIPSKLGVVLTYLPRYCKRVIVLLTVKKAFNIVNELELYLIINDHIVPLVTLHVLPELVVFALIPSIIHPYLFFDLG